MKLLEISGFIRQTLPLTLGLFTFIFAVVFIAWLIKKYALTETEEEDKRVIKKWINTSVFVLSLIAVVIYAFTLLNMASVNEIPRASIDHSPVQDMSNGYKDRLDSISKATGGTSINK